MADLFNTAISGLRSYQIALATVSHNIANVNTEGYSRQRAELTALAPFTATRLSVGEGVSVNSISRIIDNLLTTQIRDIQSNTSRLDSLTGLATRIDDIVADPLASLMPVLEQFFAAVSDVANDPSNTSPRVALLGEAESLEQRLVFLSTQLRALENEIDNRIQFAVAEINGLTQEIASVNETINMFSASSSGAPNDLFDKREALLKQLSEQIKVQVIVQNDGTFNVFVGSGQLLVNANTSLALVAQPGSQQADRLGVAIQSVAGVTSEITSSITGGELGGILEFRNTLLDTAQNRLGRIAISLSESFNAQHSAGLDLNDNLGGTFFTPGVPQVLPNNNNTGAGQVTVTVNNATQLTVSDYEVRFDGANYTITRLSDNTVVASGAGPAFVNVDGLDFTAVVAPAAGDSFYVRPTRLGAFNFQSLITDPNRIAAASPIRTLATVSNLGDVGISQGLVTNPVDPNLTNTVTINFNTPPTTFDVFDVTLGAGIAAGVVYTDGILVNANGVQVQLSGLTPQAGDVFTIELNSGGAGDNRNALLLADLQNQAVMDGSATSAPTSTYGQAYGGLTTEVGTITSRLKINFEAETTVLIQSEERREGISGVNLDEEAINLIRFQQAYEAMTRVLAVAQNTIDSLLEAL